MSETVEYQVPTSLMVPERPTAIFIPSIEDGLEAWNAYQKLCQQLLDDSDYAIIRGKKHRKRTGWTKLRRALNISVDLVESEWEELGEEDFGYRVTVRANFPDGRFEDGDGYCDSFELRGSNIEPTRHNVRAKAITRAKNRATSDIIGAGEVSAEEMVESAEPRQKKTGRRKAKNNGKTPAGFRPEFLNEFGLTDKDALSILGPDIGHVNDWLKANTGKTLADAEAEILAVSGKRQLS